MPQNANNSTIRLIRKRGKPCISIENARILRGSFRNFSGNPDKYNRSGGIRNFSIAIDDPEWAQRLIDEGWNIRIRAPKDEDESPLYHLKVTVRFDNYPPSICMLTKRNRVRLDEESIGNLDYAEILNADCVISPSYWEVNGKTGIKAYLDTLYVTIEEDYFAEKYASEEYPQE